MKKLLLISVLLCTCMMQILATDWTDSNGVTWSFERKTFYFSNGYKSYYTITAVKDYGDDVVVPEKLYVGATSYPVEAIGNSVFKDNKTLTTVSLPSTVKYIESYAYYGCQALTTVTGTGQIEYIESGAFSGCNNLMKIDLSSCQNIGYYGFQYCSALEDVVSLVACKNINDYAFYNCSSLKTVDLSDNVVVCGNAFSGCSALTSVGSLKGAKIGSYAFSGCRSLAAVDISESTSVGEYAFRDCSNLTTVGDLSAFTAVSDGVFSGCAKLEAVNISNCRSIGKDAFSGCETLQNVDLGNVKTIGESAFANCSQLKTVGDLSGFTIIPASLFSGCSELQNLELPNVTSIGKNAFNSCSSLTDISLPNVVNIDERAFEFCYSLISISLPNVTSVGYAAFSSCSSLADISLPNVTSVGDAAFAGSALTNISLPKATSVGGSAFVACSSLTDISLPNVTSIGGGAFAYCPLLNNVNITSTKLSSIGSGAFNTPGTITLLATTPPALGDNSAFGSLMVVRVPDEAVETYHSADIWSDIKARVVGIGAKLDYDVEVTAQSNHSGLTDAIGEKNLGQVVSLKVSGDINSYDIMVMRNKMDNLHYLDLTDANIVANDYEYYTGCHSEDNVLGTNSFRELRKLLSVKLPKTITSVGNYAFYNCSNLKEIEFQTGIKSIGSYAFQGCSLSRLELKKGLEVIGSYAFGGSSVSHRFEEVVFPEGLISIGSYAFRYVTTLKRVAFPSTLKTIDTYAFCRCYSLDNISLPTSLEKIRQYSFSECSSLTEVRIPSTIQKIEDYAFKGCPKLNDVYTYIVEPTPINMNTFSTYESATLHVPSTSYYNYWYDTEWSQFRTLTEFDAEYQYFYINNDFTISDEAGTIQGDEDNAPDADLNPGSGLIVETETETQKLNELHIKMKGSESASVIAANNMEANKVYFDIDIQQGRWYFLCFPFNVKTVNVEAPGNYVFRVYDPEERANGKTGWVNWIGDLLYAGQGYIFHCSKAGTLSLCVEKEDMNWNADNRPQALTSSPSQNEQDASWNFIGNPHTSYYDINKTGYTQPITVWNGTSYEAVRSGDDEYCLSPFEGFFVQKPNEVAEMEFPAEGEDDGRYTYRQMQQKNNNNAAGAKGSAQTIKTVSADRKIINLTISDGQATDKTRVVFNEQQTQDYEMSCDAAKFLSTEQVPQLYSQDNSQTKYAINERPEGEVKLGYVAATQGELTISAQRMDQPVLLRDNVMQITHDLSTSDYNFSTAAGTFNDRFKLILNPEATSVGQLLAQTGVSAYADKGGISFSGIENQNVSVYSAGGSLLAANIQNGFLALPSATYIVKVGNNSTKLLIR